MGQKVDFSFEELFFDVAEVISTSCRTKKISFDYFYDRSMPRVVVGDARQVRQTLFNLLDRSVKFTEQGTISFSTFSEGHCDDKAKVHIQIRDTGLGIPELELERLVSTLERGIEVQSEEGKGTQFDVYMLFPVADDVRLDLKRLKGQKIFVMIKGPDETQLVIDFLRAEGATVVAARSGFQALEMLKTMSENFDRYIFDEEMPDFGALSLAEKEGLVVPGARVSVIQPLFKPISSAKIEKLFGIVGVS